MKSRWGWLALLALVPCLQIASAPAWIYNTPFRDDWFYYGFFVHLRNHLHEFAGTYYATRLAWILPGALVHHFLQPIPANVVLRLLLYLTALIAAFFAVLRTYGVRCAVLCCLLLSAYPWFHTAIGWDYVDGPVGVYILIALEELSACAYELSRGRLRAAWIRAPFAGCAYAGAFHCHTLILMVIPILGAGFFLRAGVNRRSVSMLPAMLAGFALLTSALGLVSRFLGGPFLFFVPSLRYMIENRHASDEVTQRHATSAWLPVAGWLIVPLVVAALAAVVVVRCWRDRDRRDRFADASMMVLIWIEFMALEILGVPVLQKYYETSFFTPFILLAVAAVIGATLDRLNRGQFVALCAGCAALALAVGMQWESIAPQTLKNIIEARVPVAAIAAGMVVTGIASMLLKRRTIPLVLFSIALVWCFLHTEPEFRPVDRTIARDRYLAVCNTDHELARFMGTRPIWLWYRNGPGAPLIEFQPLASLFMFEYSLLGQRLPEVTAAELRRVPANARLVLLATSRTSFTAGIDALARSGVETIPVSEWHVPAIDSSFDLEIVDLVHRRVPEFIWKGAPAHDVPASQWIKEWGNDALPRDLETNFYAPGDGQLVRPGVIRASDSRDHVATKWVQLPGPSPRSVVVEIGMPAFAKDYGSGRVTLQDQNYDTLYDSGTLDAATTNILIPLKPSSTSVRVTFVPNDDHIIVEATSLRIGIAP